jgi:hypothetical protein
MFITCDLVHVFMFVTPSYGRSLRYLLKNYMLLQSCYIDCDVKDKVYRVFLKFTMLVTMFKTHFAPSMYLT